MSKVRGTSLISSMTLILETSIFLGAAEAMVLAR